MIDEAQYHAGLSKLWTALELESYDAIKAACDGEDVFTIAANVIRRYNWLLTQFAEGNIHWEDGVYTFYKSKFERLSFQGYKLDDFIRQILKEM